MINNLKAKLNSDNNLNELISGSLITFFLKISGTILSYAVIFVIANNYGAEGVGLYSLTLKIIILIAMIACFGMNVSIVRYVGQYNKENNKKKLKLLYKYALEISIPISLVLSIILYVFSESIAIFFFHQPQYKNIIEVASYIVPLMTIININVEYLRGLKDLKKSEYFRSTNTPIINLIFLLILGSLSTDKFMPVHTLAIAIFITLIFSSYFTISKIYGIRKSTTSNFSKNELVKTSFPILITSVSIFITSNMPLFLLQIFHSTIEAGIFSVAISFSLLVSLVLLVVNTISAPKFSELYWSKQYKDLQKMISQSLKIIFNISLLMAFLIFIFNKQILSLFGDEFIAGSSALIILLIGQLINALTGSAGIFLNMTGRQKALRNIIFMSMTISCLAGFVLIPLYGIKGAAITSLISTAIANFSSLYYVKTKTGFITYFVPNFILKFNAK